LREQATAIATTRNRAFMSGASYDTNVRIGLDSTDPPRAAPAPVAQRNLPRCLGVRRCAALAPTLLR
jgi:hypothetical protein